MGNILSEAQIHELINTLEQRFRTHMHRHPEVTWESVQTSLHANKEKLISLHGMEETGGEPDVVVMNSDTLLFVDCAKESPSGRRSVCYDRKAWEERKKHKPVTSALDIADEIGITILTEEEYRLLQQMEAFDLKTSSWVKTADGIRNRGGALFCDNRYGHVFTYHNGATSYYSARGFRGKLEV